MVARGRVQNGAVVLADGVILPEGQDVTARPVVTDAESGLSRGEGPHSVLDIPVVSVGGILRELDSDDEDLIEEMLEHKGF